MQLGLSALSVSSLSSLSSEHAVQTLQGRRCGAFIATPLTALQPVPITDPGHSYRRLPPSTQRIHKLV